MTEKIQSRKKSGSSTGNDAQHNRQFFEKVPLACHILDEAGSLVDVNPAWLRLFGYVGEEVAGRPFASFLRCDYQQHFKAELARCKNAGAIDNVKLKLRHHSGHAVDVLFAGKVESAADTSLQIYCFLQDITTQATVEEHLRRTLAATNDGIWEYNLQTGEYRYSKRFAEILGFSPEQFRGYGKQFQEKIHPEDRERFRRNIENYINGKSERYDIEFRLLERSGQYKWIYSRGSIVERGEDGRPLRIVGANTDIDERKRAEIILAIRLRLIESAQDCSQSEILQIIADECEHLTDSSIAFVHFLLKEKQQISLQAWSSRTQNLCCNDELHQNHYPLESAGVWADCVRHGKAMIYNDYVSLPQKKGTPAGHPRLERVVTVPVMRGDSITAIFGVGNKRSEYTEKDLADFQQIADFSWDIIERKLIVESLRSSEEKFAKTFQAAPVSMSVSSVEDGRYLQVNDAFIRLTGFDRDAVIGRTSAELGILTENDYKTIQNTLASERRIKNLELILFRSDGTEIACLLSADCIQIGEKTRVLSIASDISENKRSQAAEQQQKENLSLIFNSIPMVIALVDGKGRIIDINHRGRRFTGREKEDVLGRLGGEVFSCVNSYDGKGCGRKEEVCGQCPVRTRIENTYATGIPHLEEEATMRFVVDGREQYVDLLVSTVPINLGAKTMVLLLLNDITSRKKAEKEQGQLREQLHQALRLESVGRLAGGVAHDLNNLLSPIHGYGEMLVEDLSSNDPRREFAQQVVNGAERASDLIRQLLVFSRRQVLEFKSVDINGMLENFKKLLRRTIREDIEMLLGLSEEVAAVEADVGQLEQVIMNLAVNAQDAMIHGGTLAIETAMADDTDTFLKEKDIDPAGFVKISVRDSGHGMEASVCQQIFEPFFTTKSKEEGTGLGLSTVYGIVKQHKGYVSVDSVVGSGTVFRIYLPAIAGSIDKGDHEIAEKTERPGSETILVVEDDEKLLKLVRAALQRKGYSVMTASSAGEALMLFQGLDQAPCDMVLTDIVMPGMNGRELGMKIEERFPGMKVMYMSGYADDIITRKGVLLEQVPFLEKPFSTKTLVAKVQEVLADAGE